MGFHHSQLFRYRLLFKIGLLDARYRPLTILGTFSIRFEEAEFKKSQKKTTFKTYLVYRNHSYQTNQLQQKKKWIQFYGISKMFEPN